MELTTILGIIVALIGLLGGMVFKGVPFSALANNAAIFIILIGTTGAVLNAFPMSDIKKVPRLFGIIFTSKNKSKTNKFETIKLFIEYAQIVRKDGILALEKRVDEIDNPFIKRGMSLLVSGVKSGEIEIVLLDDIASMEKRHTGYAQIFSQAGTYAPTLGVLGAVIGLIAALGNMQDQDRLGHAISAAFMATVYGIFTGYVLWHPFANKLKRKSKEEVSHNEIVVAGVLALANGDPPYLVQDKLLSFLTQKEKEKFTSKSGV